MESEAMKFETAQAPFLIKWRFCSRCRNGCLSSLFEPLPRGLYSMISQRLETTEPRETYAEPSVSYQAKCQLLVHSLQPRNGR